MIRIFLGLFLLWAGTLPAIFLADSHAKGLEYAFTVEPELDENGRRIGVLGEIPPHGQWRLFGPGMMLALVGLLILHLPNKQAQRRLSAAGAGIALLVTGAALVLVQVHCRSLFASIATSDSVNSEVLAQGFAELSIAFLLLRISLVVGAVLTTIAALRGRRNFGLPPVLGWTYLGLALLAGFILFFFWANFSMLLGLTLAPSGGAASSLLLAQFGTRMLSTGVAFGTLLIVLGGLQQAYWFLRRPVLDTPDA